jgi:hypothetical protein
MDFLNNLPVEYRKIVLKGYYSLILLFLSCLLCYISIKGYGPLNGNFMGLLSTGLFIIGGIFFFYFFIKTSALTGNVIKQVPYRNLIRDQIVIITVSAILVYLNASLLMSSIP